MAQQETAEPDVAGTGGFDTNMEMLPGKRVKGPGEAEEAEEVKPMSKRKKRKLEQLQKKHASKELRGQLLADLQAVQLTSQQHELMRASQSTRVSRRDQVAMAKRRIESGVPLTEDMHHLRRGPKKIEEDEEDDVEAAALPLAAGTSGSSASAVPALRRFDASREAMSLAPTPAFATRDSAAETKAFVAECAGESDKEEEEKKPVLAPMPVVTLPSASSGSSSSFLLRPVRVQRTDLIEEQRSKLPAVMCEQEVVETCLGHDVTLVSGDTGCGKSTQIPQFLYEAGVCSGDKYLIGVTQPRRVAAISVSQRVGDEVNDPGTVGYQVRYDREHCSKDTKIKFMTDGILLRELQADFLCSKYAAVVIDEAHERGVNCDILIGLLSRAVQRRRKNFEEALAAGRYKKDGSADGDESLPPPPLRLVIMSATLRVCDFTQNQTLFPRPPPVVKIDARTFPVTVHFARTTEEDYIKAAHRSVLEIHKKLPPGTILVFVTGKQEVHRLCHMLRQSNARLRNTSEGADDDYEEEDEELLQDSDDEAGEFDDDLGQRAVTKAATTSAGEEQPKQPLKKKQRGLPNSARKDTSGVSLMAADDTERKLKKKQKPSDAPAEQQGSAAAVETPADADSAPEAVKRKKKKRKRAAEDGVAEKATLVGEAQQTEADKDSGVAAEAKAADAEDLNVDYRIDEEEDIVVLEGEDMARALAKDDAKDMEARRQKREKMVKLDKSRTAGGVFKGSGFGEGPIRVYPLYAQLPARDQLAAFTNPKDGERNVIVSTNVAETSVTLPNTRYVVDAGREKRRKFKASSGVSSFVVDRIAKASADQRAGRAGRLGPGHSYRLYSAAAYENHMTKFAPIAVLHVPMDPVLLLIASLGVPYLDLFPWPTPPPPEAVTAAMLRLQALGALANLDATKGPAGVGRSLRCTQLGFRLATLPVAPRYAKMLLSAVSSVDEPSSHAIAHACALVAAFSVGNLVSQDATGSMMPDVDDVPQEGENELVRAQREAGKRLREAQGKVAPRWTQLKDDADGLLWLMGGYAWAIGSSDAQAERFCRDNKANSRQMSEAHSLMQQLGSLLQRRLSLDTVGVKLDLPLKPKPPTPAQSQQLRSCIANGLVDHVAVQKPELGRNAYVCKDLGIDNPVYVHCSSNTYRHRPHPTVIAFNEIISTMRVDGSSRPFMRDCVGLDPLMLSKRAALGDCPLLQLGEFLAVPAPRYLKDKDSVLGFASPSYVPLAHILPTIEVDVPKDSIFRYKVFAKALLEGEVLSLLGLSSLLARPALVLHAPNNPRVMALVGPLWEQRIGSRADLLQHWETDRKFLLDGYLKWLPPSLHDDVRMSWPPLSAAKKR